MIIKYHTIMDFIVGRYVVSTDDTESDINRACEIFLLGNSSEIQPKLPKQSPY